MGSQMTLVKGNRYMRFQVCCYLILDPCFDKVSEKIQK
jgi:hypothetical protein